MKQPERVAELLAELRALAENDFERHRIDVLERDLTAPPVVEQINDKYQRFDGVYYSNIRGRYRAYMFIHRRVFEYYHGEIPAGYEIHHIDGNPANNDISNLQMLTKDEHTRTHAKAKEQKIYRCEFCGKIFYSSGSGVVRFCSSRCNHDWHQQQGHYTEIRICANCGNPFSAYKYNNTRYCSPACAYKDMPPTSKDKECPICHEIFRARKDKQVYCSRSCAAKGHERKKSEHTRACKFCGKIFTLKKPSSSQIYCSRYCFYADLSARKKKSTCCHLQPPPHNP